MASFLPNGVTNVSHRSTIGTQLVGDGNPALTALITSRTNIPFVIIGVSTEKTAYIFLLGILLMLPASLSLM